VKPKCRFGNHRWDHGSKGGSKCLDCGKDFGVRRKNEDVPPRTAPAAGAATPAPAPRAANEALRTRWGMHPSTPAAPEAQPDQSVQSAQTPAPGPEEKHPGDKVDLGEIIREEVPDLLIAAEQKTIEWCGRTPHEPDDRLEKKLKETTEKLLKAKMPKIEVSPWWSLGIVSGLLWAQMFYNAEKKPPAAGRVKGAPSARTKDSAADTVDTADSEESPTSSNQTRPLSLVPAGGGATGVEPSVSGD
jgi:hypothetical protein